MQMSTEDVIHLRYSQPSILGELQEVAKPWRATQGILLQRTAYQAFFLGKNNVSDNVLEVKERVQMISVVFQ